MKEGQIQVKVCGLDVHICVDDKRATEVILPYFETRVFRNYRIGESKSDRLSGG